MKRIDEKIKEIEKKDNKNRFLFFVIIGLIAAFLIIIGYYHKNLEEAEILASDAYKELKEKDDELKIELENKKLLIESLESSLKPDQYWDHVLEENSVEGYINFITNDFKIDKSDYLIPAIDKLKLTNDKKPRGYEGWLYSGKKYNSGKYISGNDEGKILKIFYRLDDKTKNTNIIDSLPNIADSIPKIGDIVRLVGKRNFTTYDSKNKDNRNANSQGFRNNTKAIVVDTHEDNSTVNFYIKIKYY